MIIMKIKDIYLGEGSYGVVTKCKNRDTGQVQYKSVKTEH